MVNSYDRCILNITMKGKQYTIAWYVDDNKVSHIDEEVIIRVIQKLPEHFGHLKLLRGKNHKSLGMDI